MAKLPFTTGRACELCGEDATGLDIIQRRYVPTCDTCHEHLRLVHEQDAAIDERDDKESCVAQ